MQVFVIPCLFGLLTHPSCDGPTICCFDAEDGKVTITVVTILATTANEKVDPKLVEVAREIQKKDPDLKGFRAATTTSQAITVGAKQTFPLIDDHELIVEAKGCTEKPGRVCLKLKAPTLNCLSYTCACGKYFPIITGYETKNGERLIIAVMVEPCKGK
jgi:hypothetical protein